MGVIYKLEPEITSFILEKKKVDVNLSCRQISQLILDKFQINVSKSSVNLIIKGAGLSAHVGRRQKKRKHRKEFPMPALPAIEVKAALPVAQIKPELTPQAEVIAPILLKSADSLLGLSQHIEGLIRVGLNQPKGDYQSLAERLIYAQLSSQGIEPSLNELGGQKEAIALAILNTLPAIFRQVRCIKLTLSNNSSFYLDAQLHTVWSVPHMPYAFCAPIHQVKNRLNNYLNQKMPLVLFMAPGYDSPTKEFFEFFLGMGSAGKRLISFTLYGNKLEELEKIAVEKELTHTFIFGLWPWQFPEYRKVKSTGEFQPYRHKHLNEDLFLADIEIELSHPKAKEAILLKGCALKKEINDKIKLLILGNSSGQISAQDLADTYLSLWPNLQEGFQDYSRKVELFTYTANSQPIFSTEIIGSPTDDAAGIFNHCLKVLDLCVRWYFLPLGYMDKDLQTAKERFYGLDCKLRAEKDFILATFSPPAGYSFLKDLQYACRRINENPIFLADGKRLWCTTP